MGREPCSGLSLKRVASTRMASNPPHEKGEEPSAPPASMRRARPLRMRQTASAMASVPVLQADELEVTWLPRPSRPQILALTLLAITCSTTRLPMRRTLPLLIMGTTLPAMVSMSLTPVPMTAPVSQIASADSRVASSGRSKPASGQASMAAAMA
jgi:hypothetical protein